MTASLSGTSVSVRISRFVATKPPRFSRTPGIGGTTADEPVAISSRAAV